MREIFEKKKRKSFHSSLFRINRSMTATIFILTLFFLIFLVQHSSSSLLNSATTKSPLSPPPPSQQKQQLPSSSYLTNSAKELVPINFLSCHRAKDFHSGICRSLVSFRVLRVPVSTLASLCFPFIFLIYLLWKMKVSIKVK